MKQLVRNNNTGDISVVEVPDPSVLPGGILVRNHFSAVSPGTDRSAIEFAKKSLIGKARLRPDLFKQALDKARKDGFLDTFRKIRNRLDKLDAIGYSSAGEVISVGDECNAFVPGDLVACAGANYANHAEVVWVPEHLATKIPDGVSTKQAAYTTLGAIAMQGIRRAELTPGETVAVIGLGIVGQLTVQILAAYRFPVMATDLIPERVDVAKKGGASLALATDTASLKQAAANFSHNGQMLDAVIITAASKTSETLDLAGELLRERGRVSVVGDVDIAIPRRLYYERELDVRVSRSYGPGRHDPAYEQHAVDYPVAYARWTETRNMAEFLRLVATGGIDIDVFTTHTFSVDTAAQAYQLDGGSALPLGILIDYAATTGSVAQPQTPKPDASKRVSGDEIGLIGAGNFMRGTLYPAIRRVNKTSIATVSAATGNSAETLARTVRGGKQNRDVEVTTGIQSVIDNPRVGVVIAAVPHNEVAEIATAALRSNKHVHVEKPLAIDYNGLESVAGALRTTGAVLSVGYNRRFAPLSLKMKEHFNPVPAPLMIQYRVNAGVIDNNHWVHDPLIGGGRIIGEVCHFIDFLQFMTGAHPVKVFASSPSEQSDRGENSENVIAAFEFSDGSRGTVLYTAHGGPSLGKEAVEVHGGGRSARLDDFKRLELFFESRSKVHKTRDDKGHRGLMREFFSGIENGHPPIAHEELLYSTMATLKTVESIRTGTKLDISIDDLV